MTAAILLAAAFCSAGQLPLATEIELPGGRRFELLADRLVYEHSKRTLSASGNAVLRVEGATLRADEILYDQRLQLATARGTVRLVTSVNGLYAALANAVAVRLEDGEVEEVFIDEGVVLQKKDVTAQALLDAKTREEVREIGTTTITLSGTHLQRRGDSEWTVQKLAFTPCDCNPRQPSWRIEASSANVNVEKEYATLWFPKVYVKSVPVLALPWIYLPLSERRTGLLVPRPNYSSLNGFSLEQPVFVTLGRSFDLTSTPGYFWGGRDPLQGIRGPRLLNEFRYVPSERTSGRATLGLLYDDKPVRDPRAQGVRLSDQARGVRFDGSLQHTQSFGSGWHDRIDASVVSDGYYVRDLTADLIARESEYLRSTAALYHRAEDHYLGLDLALRQDLRWGYQLFRADVTQDGTLLRGPNTLQRLPGVLLSLPQRRLAGPVDFSFRAEWVRLAPFASSSGDEGIGAGDGRLLAPDGTPISFECLQDRLFNPGQLSGACPAELAPDKSGQGDRRFQEGERQARQRLDLLPKLSTTLHAGSIARVSAYAAYRQDLYFQEAQGRFSQRGYPMGGLVLGSQLARAFGKGDQSLRHEITPEASLLYVPTVVGADLAPYDEIDNALSGKRRALQLVAELRQRLLRKDSGVARELLRLDLGQGFDLLPGGGTRQLADSFVRLAANYQWLRVSGLARFNPERGALDHVSASASLDTGQGQVLLAGYDNLFNQGSDRTRRGIDLLVGPAPGPFAPDYAEQVTAGARLSFKFGLGLRYDALFLRQSPATAGEPSSLRLKQHIFGVGYGPACDCWRLEVHATQRPSESPDSFLALPDFGANLTISRFGSFGAGQ